MADKVVDDELSRCVRALLRESIPSDLKKENWNNIKKIGKKIVKLAAKEAANQQQNQQISEQPKVLTIGAMTQSKQHNH